MSNEPVKPKRRPINDRVLSQIRYAQMTGKYTTLNRATGEPPRGRRTPSLPKFKCLENDDAKP